MPTKASPAADRVQYRSRSARTSAASAEGPPMSLSFVSNVGCGGPHLKIIKTPMIPSKRPRELRQRAIIEGQWGMTANDLKLSDSGGLA